MSNLPEPELVLQGGAPVHRQIEDQIRDHIALGWLRPGEELPSVRAVAVGLAVSPAAVGQAYRDLERDGFLTVEDGSGVFVAPVPPARPLGTGQPALLESLCADFLARAGRYGFPPAAVEATLRHLTQRRASV